MDLELTRKMACGKFVCALIACSHMAKGDGALDMGTYFDIHAGACRLNDENEGGSCGHANTGEAVDNGCFANRIGIKIGKVAADMAEAQQICGTICAYDIRCKGVEVYWNGFGNDHVSSDPTGCEYWLQQPTTFSPQEKWTCLGRKNDSAANPPKNYLVIKASLKKTDTNKVFNHTALKSAIETHKKSQLGDHHDKIKIKICQKADTYSMYAWVGNKDTTQTPVGEAIMMLAYVMAPSDHCGENGFKGDKSQNNTYTHEECIFPTIYEELGAEPDPDHVYKRDLHPGADENIECPGGEKEIYPEDVVVAQSNPDADDALPKSMGISAGVAVVVSALWLH